MSCSKCMVSQRRERTLNTVVSDGVAGNGVQRDGAADKLQVAFVAATRMPNGMRRYQIKGGPCVAVVE